MLQSWSHSITTKNYAETCYQTIEEIPWHLGLIKLKKQPDLSKSLQKLL